MLTARKRKGISPLFEDTGEEDIFSSMTALANQLGALNFGQGDSHLPLYSRYKEAFLKYVADDQNHKYGPPGGLPGFREAVAENSQNFWGIETDPDNVLSCAGGATETLNNVLRVLLNAGDEVIVFDPSYNFYRGLIERAGGRLVPVQLHSPDWTFDPDELDRAVTSRTKAILVPRPGNPVDLAFDAEQQQALVDTILRHGLLLIEDRAYEFYTRDFNRYRPFHGISEIKDHCISVRSAGKTTGSTGGTRLGYMEVPTDLVQPFKTAIRTSPFCAPKYLELAFADLLRDDQYLRGLGPKFNEKAGLLRQQLEAAGLDVLPYKAGFFLVADYGQLGLQGSPKQVAENIVQQHKVAALPIDAFRFNTGESSTLLRFCLARKNAVIEQVGENLKGLEQLAAG